jgi:hypothetical protein
LSKKPVFSGPDLTGQVAAFQALLVAAYTNDWEADEAGRPTPPRALPGTRRDLRSVSQPATGPTQRSWAEESQAAVGPFVVPAIPSAEGRAEGAFPMLPATGPADDVCDVARLVRWYSQHVDATFKRQGGKRSPTTTNGYKDALKFLTTLARYQPGDPRLGALGLEAGASMRCDDPATGINEHDLILLLETRATTNLRSRKANHAAMTRWATICDNEGALAAKHGRSPMLPPPPEPRPEEATERTIEAFARVVKAMFDAAYKRKLIPYLPCTPSVDDEGKHAPAIHYTTKTVPDLDQVRRAAATMGSSWRLSSTPDGYPVSINGGRFQALIWLAGTQATRPEESIAIRDSWVILDDGDPRIELHGAEVYHPTPGGGRMRVGVPLKHREWGDIRVIRPETEDVKEFCAVLAEHRQRYVAAATQFSPDPDERDPHFFTTHRGDPIDLSNFSDKWWKPAAAQAFTHPGEAPFAGMPFRRLRAAAITGWLVRGCTTEEAAAKAGVSQAVLEKHYKGVLSVRSNSRRVSVAADMPALLAASLDSLDEAQLWALVTSAKAELRGRLDRA